MKKKSAVLVESSNISVKSEVIPEVAVEEKPKATLQDVIALTFVFTVIEILKLQMKEEQKANMVSDADFIKEISRGLHDDLLEKAYNKELGLDDYDEIYDSEEDSVLDSDFDNDISDDEMVESAFEKGSNVAKLLAARQNKYSPKKVGY